MGLLRAAHIEPCLAVTGITTLLGLGLGLGWRAGWVAAAVLAGQLAVGWHNDVVDAERDRASGRDDKPVPRGEVSAALLRRLVPIALALALACSLVLGVAAAAVHVVGLGSALAYNAWLKTTPVSVLPWALSFGLLPAFPWLAAVGAPPWWAMATGAMLGAGAHFTNALPDLERDEATGVRGLPHRLGARRSIAVGAVLLGAGAITVAAGASGGPDVASGAELAVPLAATLCLAMVAGVLLAGAAGRHRLAFRLTMLAAAVLVAAFVGVGALSAYR